MTSRIRQVQLRHVERHARKAIGNLLGYAARDSDLYRIEFEGGSTDLFELTDFRE
ncbi:Uncharacterised protein [Mycobacteroides abscessus subsp. abscessus]|nr:Uncharacterised protein [Mycobacteroides abscessus subsp. abscessus]SIN14955.1 Uncharacterised protein [Mycobacteroides abscessus subsp. abscessus]